MKNFYIIGLDCSESFATLCKMIEHSCKFDINWYQETCFSHYVNSSRVLYSCDEDDTSKFEEMLRKFNISFNRLDFLKQSYELYKFPLSEELKNNGNISKENKIFVIEENFPSIIEGPNGSQIFNEHTVERMDSIKIYVESKERCRHNIPHVHVDYNKMINVFSISLVNCVPIEGNYQGAKAKKAIEILKNNLEKARKIWNEKSDSHSKFDKDQNGNLLSTYHFEK